MEIRNFCIIAHIDHGKSTLSDRFLEETKTVPKEKLREQFLDLMDLEREKGVTIKMQPVRMSYNFKGKEYILNLIDTPGHVDFFYEVSRALKAVEGAILLVDAQKGIQAQTVSNFNLAKKANLKIIPALNKIDLEIDNLSQKKKALAELINSPLEKISLVSAKKGIGIKELLERVIEEIPSPVGKINLPFSALIFDAQYDEHLGIIVHVRIKNGRIKNSQECILFHQKEKFEVKALGIFSPQRVKREELIAGEIGWIATGIKEPGKIFIGDTIVKFSDFKKNKKFYIFEGFKKPQPVVFANLYPKNPKEYDLFKKALEKIYLTDPSLSFQEISTSLGRGFQVGFLGLFHLEIITKRLEKEFKIETTTTLPTVLYKVKKKNGEIVDVVDVTKLPPLGEIKEILEPKVALKIFLPNRFLNQVMKIAPSLRFEHLKIETLKDNVEISCKAPLSKIIQNFDDILKSKTEGFGSFYYKVLGFEKSDIVKVEILVAKEVQSALSFLIHRSEAEKKARELVKKLKELLPREQFPVILQGAVNGKIVARETIPALKKDVTAPLYGGDFSRKKKLLVKQRKGKKELLRKGKVRISPEIFIKILRKS